MTHLKRSGLLLAAVLGFVFIGLRVMPVPETLADYGFHQPDEEINRQEWAALPVQFASSSRCADCHQENYAMWQKGDHQTVSCENCHGPGREHLETGAPLELHTERELCGTCHARLVSRPVGFPQVDMAEMGHGEKCVSCHDPHEPRAGMPPQVPHSLEDRTECQSCHGKHEPWEEPPPTVPHTMEGRTECLTCHGPEEIRGLELPHIPHSLEGREDCLECHNSGAIKPFPADHVGRKSVSCQICHQPAEVKIAVPVASAPVTLSPEPEPEKNPETAETGDGPARIPHDLEGREDCLMCHSAGDLAVPEDHSGRTSDTCTGCHSGA